MKEVNLSKHQKRAIKLAQTTGVLQRESKHWWYPSVKDRQVREQKTKKAVAKFYKHHPRWREGFGLSPQEVRNLETKSWKWENENCVGTQTVLSLVRRGLMQWAGPDWVDKDFWYEVKNKVRESGPSIKFLERG